MIKLDDIDLVLYDTDHRVLTVIEALMFGLEVDLSGTTLRMARTLKGGVCPVSILEDNNVIGLPDLSLQWISEVAANMYKEDYDKLKFDLAAAKTLYKINNKR